MSLTVLQNAALIYGKAGIKIFSLIPGEKIPRIRRWRERATCDLDEIRFYWGMLSVEEAAPILDRINQPIYEELENGEFSEEELEELAEDLVSYDDGDPRNNIGILTGPENNLSVIDVDSKMKVGFHSGLQSWEALQDQYKVIESSVTTRTPTGGTHHIFQFDPRIRTTVNPLGALGWTGIDFRSAGGMVVAPPSMIRQKIANPPFRYHFPGISEDVTDSDGGTRCIFSLPDFSQVPAFPEPVARLLEEHAETGARVASSTTYSSGVVKQSLQACLNYITKIPGVVEGTRNDAAMGVCRVLAGKFRNLDLDDQLTALRKYNDTCQPRLRDRDLQRKLRSTLRRRDEDEAVGREWAKPKPFFGGGHKEVIPDRFIAEEGDPGDAEEFLESRVPAEPANLDLACEYLTKRYVNLTSDERLSVLELWADGFDHPPSEVHLEERLEAASKTRAWKPMDEAVRERIANLPRGLLGIRRVIPRLKKEFPSISAEQINNYLKEHLNNG